MTEDFSALQDKYNNLLYTTEDSRNELVILRQENDDLYGQLGILMILYEI